MGGDSPIRVQSMTKTDTRDIQATASQIRKLEKAGCEIIRVAVPDLGAAQSLGKIKKQIRIPLVADIHFDYRLALEAIKQGVDKIRINPGNIGGKEKVKAVVKACQERKIPLRIGVNSGSLEQDLLAKYGKHGIAYVMVKSAERHLKILEDLNFFEIVVSLKAADPWRTIEAYQLFSQKYDYPLHLGVTEAGISWKGVVRSSVGIGALLAQGIGDTLRVSLTADPLEEVKAGFEILKSLGLRQYGPTLISCPTCGRCEIDLRPYAQKIEKVLEKVKKPLKVALMGCVVNGPGEAREADIGIAGGKKQAALFVKGKIVRTLKAEEIVPVLLAEIKKFS